MCHQIFIESVSFSSYVWVWRQPLFTLVYCVAKIRKTNGLDWKKEIANCR